VEGAKPPDVATPKLAKGVVEPLFWLIGRDRATSNDLGRFGPFGHSKPVIGVVEPLSWLIVSLWKKKMLNMLIGRNF
jgi:hypothetical protein